MSLPAYPQLHNPLNTLTVPGICTANREREAPAAHQQRRARRSHDQSPSSPPHPLAGAREGAGVVSGLLYAVHRLPAGQNAIGESLAVGLCDGAYKQ